MSEPNVVSIKVSRAAGGVEVLTLTGPLDIIPASNEGGMARIVTATGMEHWFQADGSYDGWGMTFPNGGIPVSDPSEGIDIALAIDAEREIIPPSKEPL